MSAKAPPVGWVVQATIAAPPAPPSKDGAKWVGDKMPDAPSFRYFNVAIADPNKAVEATAKYLAKAHTEGGLSAVRELSSAEVAALSLKAGEVKPA
jgi:3-deoxy-D-manno-octulosonate 8-phosphate phosphatase KdsC-like HAD superfamily phosphatase